MKEKLIIFIVLFCLILLTGCSKSSTEVEDEYTSYYITITNNNSYDITELVISMVGSEDIQEISILTSGETTDNFEFVLPPPSDDNPISFGDYNLSYKQDNEQMYFGITLPETHISVLIEDDGFSVENMIHLITIMNSSSYDIFCIEIRMIGGSGICHIDKLLPGENSSEFESHLVHNNPVPSSFGCYDGSYFQNGIKKFIFLSPTSGNEIILSIFDWGYGYTIED